MNEKHAKALRRKIRNHPDAHQIPDVNYIQRERGMKRFPLTGARAGVNEDGTPCSVVLPMRQITLGNCKRAIYQRVKRALR